MNRFDATRRLYVLRDHLGLTRSEFHGLLILGLLLGGGVLLRDLRTRIPAIDPATYLRLEEEFRARSWAAPDPAPIGPVLPPETTPLAVPLKEIQELLNLNTATSTELQTLPRIGPAMAARILEHRRLHGPFRGADDLLLIRGIGKATLAQIRPLVVAGPSSNPK